MSLERTPVTLTFVITTIMMYMFYQINPETFTDLFAFQTHSVLVNFIPWQLLTYAFYFPGRIFFFIFTVIIYLVIGSGLEQLWGSLKFGIFILIVLLSRSVPALLLGTGSIDPLQSSWFMHVCLYVAFGFNFPERKFHLYFFIPVKVKILGIIGLCICGFYLILPFIEYGNYFMVLSPGLIKLPVPIALFLVNGLSCVSLLIYWRSIFSHGTVDSVVTKIRDNIQSVEEDNKRLLKIQGNKKYADLLTDYQNDLDYDASLLDKYDENNSSLCDKADFNKDDPYCLECEKFPHCAKRFILSKKNKK